MYSYEERFDMVVMNAWEIITNNGLGLDDEMSEHYVKAIRDKTANNYFEDISNKEWLYNVLVAMGYEQENY